MNDWIEETLRFVREETKRRAAEEAWWDLPAESPAECPAETPRDALPPTARAEVVSTREVSTPDATAGRISAAGGCPIAATLDSASSPFRAQELVHDEEPEWDGGQYEPARLLRRYSC